MKVSKIIDQNSNLLAIIIPHNYKSKGVNFITNSVMNFQLAYIEQPQNYVVKKHRHPEVDRKIFQTSEFMFIRKGELEITFYSSENEFLEKYTLISGDAILIFSGVHCIKFIKNTELIEVRQGPYIEGYDKEYL